MRNILAIFLVLFGAVLISVGIGTPLVPPADASPAVPAVYDSKQMAGSACKISACTFIPTTVAGLQNLTVTTGTHQLIVHGGSPTDTCDVTCPISRDRYQDGVGPRGAWVDVEIGAIVSPPPDRKISCRLENTTGAYTLNGLVKTWAELGPFTSTPTPATQNYQRINLTIPYPNVPQEPWSHGATYANGYSAIVCTMPMFTTIHGYGWVEYGGESTDW